MKSQRTVKINDDTYSHNKDKELITAAIVTILPVLLLLQMIL